MIDKSRPLDSRRTQCVKRCADMVASRTSGMLESCWLDGAEAAADAICARILDRDGGTVVICGVEVLPVFPDTSPELVERLRKAVRDVVCSHAPVRHGG